MTTKEAIKVLRETYCGNEAICELSRIDLCRTTDCEIYHAIKALEAEPQRAYEQGWKDALDKYDETCRIASDIRCAMGCKTSKECRDLISNGEIQRMKHGRWIKNEDRSGWHCSCCGKDNLYAYPYAENNERELQDFYCPNCGADMRGEENV